ncbi:MAG TPA: 6-bladed beta-propeller [Candidatus Dormibacteraeota bacterium]|nr:6-bladed beta-propeller [Candidatus Dormibacteraeota bacterium]
MRRRMVWIVVIAMTAAGFVAGVLVASRMQSVQAQQKPFLGYAAVPGEKGGEDVTGPYEPVVGWPKPLSSVPGNKNWTWGAVEGIFAESPNRVFIAERGELPELKRPANTAVPQFGPSLSFPTAEVPFRNASQGPVASLPGGGAPGDLPQDADKNWKGRKGVDARWKDNLVVVNAEGDITEQWTQWDNFFKRPHAVYINPYDPQKSVWVVDDFKEALFRFSNDGKKLLQTIGTPNQAGADGTHFNRPTFLTWLPDSTMFVADGYNGTRVAKFDKNGKFLMDWGKKGIPPNEMRPGYFNTVHGIAADPVTHHVYVVDRSNHRIQVFDENGKFLDQWPLDKNSSVNFLYMSADRHLWAADDRNSRIVEYDLQGHLLYTWGTLSDRPGGLFNTHGMSVDQEGNFYVAEVGNGRAQKFRPRPGANPALLIGKPVYSAWK